MSRRISLAGALRRLHSAEVACGLQADGDTKHGRVEVWIGNDLEGDRARKAFSIHSLDCAAEWLVDEARRIYPARFPDKAIEKLCTKRSKR